MVGSRLEPEEQSIIKYLRSYPNNKKPIVAITEMHSDSFRPDMPAYLGGMIATIRTRSETRNDKTRGEKKN